MAFAAGLACAPLAALGASSATVVKYPNDYASIVAAAKQESHLTILGSTNERLARFLIDDFAAVYPEIDVSYVALPPAQIDRRLRARDAAQPPADVVWSIGMDLQMKQALEGHALTYRSPEASALPAWAKWHDQLYGTTYEPVALAYNRRLVSNADVPRTRAALLERLQANRDHYRNKVTTYSLRNPEVGAIAFRFDSMLSPGFWQLMGALGSSGVALELTTEAMMDRLSSGQSLIAYNVMASEAINRAKRDPTIGIAFMTDYDVVLSRVLMITKRALHPNAAKLWIDYVLSPRGQKQLQIANMYPIRDDVAKAEPGVELLRKLKQIAKPAELTPALAQFAASATSDAFYDDMQRRWSSDARRVSILTSNIKPYLRAVH